MGIIELDSIVRVSRWDGSPIGLTKECQGCPYRKPVMRDDELAQLCTWGVAWKVLSEVENPKSCQKLKQERPKYAGRLLIK